MSHREQLAIFVRSERAAVATSWCLATARIAGLKAALAALDADRPVDVVIASGLDAAIQELQALRADLAALVRANLQDRARRE